MKPITDDPVVRLKDSAAVLGIKRGTLHAWVQRGIIQKPLELGPRARGYRQSTLRAFLDSREVAAS